MVASRRVAVVLLFALAMLTVGFGVRSAPGEVDSAACGRALTIDSGQQAGEVRVAPEPQNPLVASQYSGVSSYDGSGVTMSALPGTAIHSPIPGRVVQAGQLIGTVGAADGTAGLRLEAWQEETSSPVATTSIRARG